MSAVVVDTHAVLWYLNDDPRLSPGARHAIANAEAKRNVSHAQCGKIHLVPKFPHVNTLG